MAVGETKAQVRALYERLGRDKLSALDAILASDFVDHDPENPTGDREGARQLFEMLFAAFPDLRAEVEDVLVDGDKAAARVTFVGTHRGGFQGIAPTGKEVRVRAIDILRLRHGRIAEHWGMSDNLSLLQQLGAMPGPEQGPASA